MQKEQMRCRAVRVRYTGWDSFLYVSMGAMLWLSSGLVNAGGDVPGVRSAPEVKPDLRPSVRVPGKAVKAGKAIKAKKDTAPKPPDPNRLEWGLLPAIDYSSDLGLGLGAIFSLAKFKPGYRPYQWRLEALFFLTLNPVIGGGVEVPFHDDYIMLDMPGLAGGKLRLNARLRFARFSNSGYYGLGNEAANDPKAFKENIEKRYYQYDRIYPSGELSARIGLWKHKRQLLELFVGARFTYNWIDAFKQADHQSKLREDLARASAFVQGQLVGTDAHGELLGNLGVIYDSRNHEYAPSRGMFHEISMRFGKGVGAGFIYGGANLTARFFFSLFREYLVLAVRLMGDMLFGQVPFYELARHGGLMASEGTGGSKSIRGILTQRFHGRGKVLGNFELRSKFLPFQIASERFSLGAIAFFDVGRSWADLSPHPELDGTGIGLKMGVGGGLRLQWGETFVVRADVAWSPTDDNIGVYIDINHIF